MERPHIGSVKTQARGCRAVLSACEKRCFIKRSFIFLSDLISFMCIIENYCILKPDCQPDIQTNGVLSIKFMIISSCFGKNYFITVGREEI